MKKTAKELFAAAFAGPRDPRSAEYKSGVLAALKFYLGEAATVGPCPYPLGSARQDAWLAGTNEGHDRGRAYLDKWRYADGDQGRRA